ncbi:MAG: carboxypeptidase-like regulatory domain-containing protein [Mariniphaga sp.]|nr:carboxypeptidase-like regulatory domain-containing protein [Mariniphaga sp.]
MTTFKLLTAFFLAGILLTPRIYAQRISIDGYVVNSKSGEYVKEVNILDEISGIGTISDNTGYFKLTLNAGDVQLTFYENAYKSFLTDFSVKNDTVLTVKMKHKKDLKADTLLNDESQVLISSSGIKRKHRK